jgi:hypothetical protein
MGGALGNAQFITLGVYAAVYMNKDFTPLGKGVNHRNADTVKASGHFIGLFVEFTPGVEPGHNEFQSTDPLTRVYIYRNATAVVLDPDYIIPLQNHEDIAAKALHGLVYGIIYDLKHQVVKAVYTGSPNIHTGTLPYRFETL